LCKELEEKRDPNKEFEKVEKEEKERTKCPKCDKLKWLNWKDNDGVMVCDDCYINSVIKGATVKQIAKKYFDVYGRPIEYWQLTKEILPALEMAGLIVNEVNPVDKRGVLINIA